jgi:glycosyltransferase involved in cell wall biosynthesis
MMGTPPRVSVVLPTYNREALLRHTLDSLTGQDLPPGAFEVLVCDDGSTDGTGQLVAGYRDRLDIRYFHHQDEGFAVARTRNVGIRHARGDVCVFVDSGIILHSGCLRAHLNDHDTAPVPVAVVGYLYGFDPTVADKEPLRRVIDTADPDGSVAALAERGWGDVREEFYRRYGDEFHQEPAPWLVYWTANASARTADLRDIGMFDEAFRQWGGEDADLGYRLHLAGVRIVLDRDAKALDNPHESDFGANMASLETNYRYMVEKYRTPVMDLVATSSPADFFDLNRTIRELGLPRCADVLARRDGSR